MPALLCSARMTVEIRHLRAFLTIAEERSLTRAAQRLHLTQPALSRTLAPLERNLAAVVDRSTHHVELTDAGRRFEQGVRRRRAFETAIVSVMVSSRRRASTTPGPPVFTFAHRAGMESAPRRARLS